MILRNMRPREILLGLTLLLVVPSAAVGQDHFPATDDLELMLRFLVEDGETPGIVLGVLEADGSTRIGSYGNAGPDARPLGPHSVFEIGSITKTFTATLLADMVLRGEVALEDPVAKYLPEHVTAPSRSGREITLLDLVTHRSGLPSVPDDFGRISPDIWGFSYTVEDAYAFLSQYELPREPGARREYSNFGFGLLGHALGRAAGSSYRELARERILEPLGMDRTGFTPDGELAQWMARGHRSGEAVRHRTYIEIFEGAGALLSNAEDLLKFMKAHIGSPGSDLEQAMRMAVEIRDPGGREGAGYGLAWASMVQPGQAPVVGHGGGTAGFSSMLSFMPERGIGTVVLANDANFEDNLGMTLLNPDPPPAEWERVRVDPNVLARYVGTYRATAGSGQFYVRLEDEGYLTYQPERRVRARLYATSDSTFYLLRGPWSFTFQTNEDGEVVGMRMQVDEREPGQRGMDRAARRVGDDTPPPAVVAGNTGRGIGWGHGAGILLGMIAAIGIIVALRRTWWK